jgi:nicotinate phosphoribosyltransferase
MPLRCEIESTPLLTDLYQLSMFGAYVRERMWAPASFELYFRRPPAARGFLVAAGLEQALDFLEGLRFTTDELDWLRAQPWASPELVEALRELRYGGDVDAVPEGTVLFADEPLLRVTAPLPVAQLVESRLINLLHYQTLVASKAVRSVLAAPPGCLLVDFGLRRAHGAEAGLLAARASYLAGFAGTATVLAGARWGIPVYGTMAHSYVQAHDDEADAFRAFARGYPGAATLLIDTYDTEAGARKVAELARELAAGGGPRIAAVRIDSGDLGAHARRVRAILDDAGLHGISIFASGNLDEYAIAALAGDGAPIGGYGVGTALATSADAPALDCVYKLVEYEGRARRKRSEHKTTWPGRKQVYRMRAAEGRFERDVLALAGEAVSGEPLLVPVMRAGRRLAAPEPLAALRARMREQLAALPEPLRRLAPPALPYPVEVSAGIRALAAELDAAGI